MLDLQYLPAVIDSQLQRNWKLLLFSVNTQGRADKGWEEWNGLIFREGLMVFISSLQFKFFFLSILNKFYFLGKNLNSWKYFK